MTELPKQMTVTIKLTDNPMAGLPGQNDLQIVVSGEPDINWDEVDGLPDPATMPASLVAAVEMLQHITGMAHEAVFYDIGRGGFSDN